ncbi:hypothetical protein Prudu_019252 [Prunus dulcis]|uniref:Uncharacterized protein n=1 Tax=Prunus dulcis TaxID=3755 RepID=A0A4Y1RSK9_PRUDU|nr:hypothetical protein Prudu_019252 [Prunus dulcis]
MYTTNPSQPTYLEALTTPIRTQTPTRRLASPGRLMKSIHCSLDDDNLGTDAFPEALFHQLLPAMVHPDHETRVGALRVFSVVLVPSSVCPGLSSSNTESRKAMDFPRTLSRTVSVFSSSAALFEKLRREKIYLRERPLPPSRRRSLFNPGNINDSLLSKAYNILLLFIEPRHSLMDKTVDLFLHLVEDRKLQAVKTGSDHPTIAYGSKEDDNLALKSLSEIAITESKQGNSLLLSCEELGQIVRWKILCLVCEGGNYYIRLSKKDGSSFDSQKNNSANLPDLLSVNQLMESVLETAHQVGRLSISNAPDVPYKEMAGHCEELLIGKQQKMSKPGIFDEPIFTNRNNDVKWMMSDFQADACSHKSSNPFADQTATSYIPPQTLGCVPMMCATECQQHAHSFSLPASSPYDNFLKAAGC